MGDIAAENCFIILSSLLLNFVLADLFCMLFLLSADFFVKISLSLVSII